MHKSWKFWAMIAGAALLGVVIDIKSKRKVTSLIASIPFVGSYLGT